MKFSKRLGRIIALALMLVVTSVVMSFAEAISGKIDGLPCKYEPTSDTTATLLSIGLPDHDNGDTYTIPSEVEGYTITAIGSGRCIISIPSKWNKVIVPDTVKSIGYEGIYEFEADTVELGTGLEKLGDCALSKTATKVVFRGEKAPEIEHRSIPYGATVYIKNPNDYRFTDFLGDYTRVDISEYTGSILSQGNIIIIAVVSAIAIAAIVILVLKKKRKAA